MDEVTDCRAAEILEHAEDAYALAQEMDEELDLETSSRAYSLLDDLRSALGLIADRAQELVFEAEEEE